MRGLLLSTLFLSFLAAPGVRADPRADALALLEEAIRAQGGKDGLTKAATFQRYGNGTLILPGPTGAPTAKQSFTDFIVGKLPGKLRVNIDLEKRLQITMIVDDKKGWKSSGGTTVELSGNGLEELQEEAYVRWLETLVPLLGNGFTLTTAGQAERDGKAVVGIKVASKGHPEATLWFDKGTKLLVLIEKEASLAGKKVQKSYAYASHKEFAGVKLPTRITEKIEGNVVTEATITDYRFPDKIDDAFFGRP
jgi:hypothetical protein